MDVVQPGLQLEVFHAQGHHGLVVRGGDEVLAIVGDGEAGDDVVVLLNRMQPLEEIKGCRDQTILFAE